MGHLNELSLSGGEGRSKYYFSLLFLFLFLLLFISMYQGFTFYKPFIRLFIFECDIWMFYDI